MIEDAPPVVNLIISSEKLYELQWIKELLAGLKVKTIVAPRLDVFLDNSIYVLSADHNPLAELPNVFFTCLKTVRSKGLFHISDEFFRGHYEPYESFDFVIRQYASGYFNCPGIITVPLGYTNELKGTGLFRPSSSRRQLWSFAGNLTPARRTMIKEFETITPNRCLTYGNADALTAALTKDEYRSMLSDSVFCPCPMGNVVMETYRLYEALEMGCIPLIDRRPFMDYYRKLMPDQKIPSFATWSKASQFVQNTIKSDTAVDVLQQEVYGWWIEHKLYLQKRLTHCVQQTRHTSYQSDLKRWNKKRAVS